MDSAAEGVAVPAPAGSQPELPRRFVAGYAMGSLGTGVYSTVPTMLLLYYCTEVLGIAAAAAAFIVFLPKAWAVVCDPLVGVWSDRTRSRFGRRGPFLLAGAFGVAATFVLLFNAPRAAPDATFMFMLAYFLLATAYSVFAVPYIAVPAEASADPVQRERLLSWRMSFAMVGVLAGAGVAPHLVALAGGGRTGYSFMSVAIAAACGAAMYIAFLATRTASGGAPVQAAAAFGRRDLIRLLRNREYTTLWIAYLLQLSGASLFIAITPYFIAQLLRRAESDAGTAVGVLLIGTLIAIPAWTKLLRRMDAWRALALAALSYAATVVAFGFIPHGASFGTVLVVYGLLGVSFAGIQLVPFTLLAHIVHADAQRSGAHSEGLYTGVWTAGEKLALAIGPAVAGLGLAALGYRSGVPQQTTQTLAGMQWLMALGPAIFQIAGLLALCSKLPRFEDSR